MFRKIIKKIKRCFFKFRNNDPFKKECIKSIYLHAFKWSGVFEGRIDFEGSVSFKSGNTEAEQKFKASSLPELYMQIQQFCESL